MKEGGEISLGMTDPKPEFAFAAPDVAGEIGRWLAYLGHERRMSPKTLDAYTRDISQFLAFLASAAHRR